MCATCVSQGALYLGGSVGALRVMALRAGRRRRSDADEPSPVEQVPEPAAESAQ